MVHESRSRFAVIILLAGFAIIAGFHCARNSPKSIEKFVEVTTEPRISPDYTDIVIPANIAPINFRILEKGQQYFVRVHTGSNKAIQIFSKTGQVRILPSQWRALLESGKGSKILFDIYVMDAERKWRKFRSITNTIAEDDI